MFLRISRNIRGEKKYEYAEIAERYRESGKQKTRILKYLGPVKNEDDMARYRHELDLAREEREMGRDAGNGFTILSPLEYGIPYAVMEIMKKTGLLKVIRKYTSPYTHLITMMAIGEIMRPYAGSAGDLYSRIYYPWSRIEINENNLYHALEKLESVRNEMEPAMFRMLRPDTSIVHFDLATVNFEGNLSDDFMLFGYSNDKKRGTEQVVVGMVVAGGIPVHCESWTGNSVSENDLETSISTVRNRFRVRNIILVSDRKFARSVSPGIFKRNRYITTAYRYDCPFRKMIIDAEFTENDIYKSIYAKEVGLDRTAIRQGWKGQGDASGMRFIVVYDKDREIIDLNDLEDKIDLVRKKMAQFKDQRDLKRSLGELRPFVKFTDRGPVLNGKWINIVRKLAGRFMIVTNTNIPVGDVIETYRNQWSTERSFRIIRSILKTRPSYRRDYDLIGAHVFMQMISLILSKIIESGSGMPLRDAMMSLSSIKVFPVALSSGEIVMVNRSGSGEAVLNKMGIPYPEISLPNMRKKNIRSGSTDASAII